MWNLKKTGVLALTCLSPFAFGQSGICNECIPASLVSCAKVYPNLDREKQIVGVNFSQGVGFKSGHQTKASFNYIKNGAVLSATQAGYKQGQRFKICSLAKVDVGVNHFSPNRNSNCFPVNVAGSKPIFNFRQSFNGASFTHYASFSVPILDPAAPACVSVVVTVDEYEFVGNPFGSFAGDYIRKAKHLGTSRQNYSANFN